MRGLLMMFAIVCLALPVQAVQAEPELQFGVAVFDFGGAFLGQAPDDDMICTRGPCFSVDGAEVPKSRQFIFPVYKKPLEATHYGKVEITAPQYFFFEGQLFQILFKVQCAADEAEACLERMVAQLHKDYTLTMVRGRDREDLVSREYRTESGAVVQVLLHDTSAGESALPTVKIFDKTLMDGVRVALNPNYVPAEYR